MAVWRTLFELSCMSNNQEWVLHTSERIPSRLELEVGAALPPEYPGADARHLFSRQVLPEELAQGLNTNFRGTTRWNRDESKDEKIPELTSIIDELTKMLAHVQSLSSFMEPKQALVWFLANDFYDCMSGGSSVYALAMVRELVDLHKIDLTMEVYPAPEHHQKKTGRDWYNLADFLKEIESIPRLDIRKYLPAGLPVLGATT